MFCKSSPDIQEHALECHRLKKQLRKDTHELLTTVTYNTIFSDTVNQLQITKVYQDIIRTRERIRTSTLDPTHPGKNTGPG